MEIRTAVVRRRNGTPTPETVAAYLPSNYAILATTEDKVIIQGTDYAGWTLDGYVIPRLGSGLIYCAEVIVAVEEVQG